MTTNTAIATAEDAYATNLSLYLDDYTDGYEATLLDYTHRERYTPINDFRVDQVDDTWILNTAAPCFYPDCALVEYLVQEFFLSATIEDEYNLVIRLHNNSNTIVDIDYISESFDKAIAWLPKWKKAMEAYYKMEAAREEWERLQKALYT